MSQKIFALLAAALLLMSCDKSSGPDAVPTPPPQPAPPPLPVTQADILAVDNRIATLLSTYNIPGASLAVTKNGKLVYRKGYGLADRSTNQAVVPANRFRLASLSKVVTAVAILKLVQDGKLSLDAKVFGTGGILANDYGTPPYNAHLLGMTLRHLLQHVSGSWGDITGGEMMAQNASLNNKQFFDWVLTTRPNPKAPGSVFDYANMNYWIAGRIIEKISAKTYVSFIREDVMAPLGITLIDKAGKTEAEAKSDEVKYYGQGNDAGFVYNFVTPRRDADGGLLSSAPDMAKFLCAVDGFSTRPDVLNSASITAMTTGSAVYPSYGLGINTISAENAWFHHGSLPGTRTCFVRNGNGVTVVLLLNSRIDPAGGGDAPFSQAILNLLLDLSKNSAYNWQDIDQF